MRLEINGKNIFKLVDAWVKSETEGNKGEGKSEGKSRYYFRGEPQWGLPLIPSLLRKNTFDLLRKKYGGQKTPTELEQLLIQRFKRYTSHIYHSHSDFHGRNFTDLEMLCLAQHNGLPTLLLDWSLNPFVALYFALRSHYYQDPNKSDDACLWVMELAPKEERQHLTVHLEDPSESWSEHVNSSRRLCPLLVVPLVFTHRIAAQAGRFVYAAYMNDSEKGLDTLQTPNKPWKSLVKYRIPASERQALLQRLTIIGMHEGTLFPDLEGWAKFLKDGNL